MKKYYKVFLITILICAVVGLTVFFFFKNNKKADNTSEKVTSFILSNKAADFEEKLQAVNANSSTKLPNRFSLVIETNENLNLICENLNQYLVLSSQYGFTGSGLTKRLRNLESSRNTCLNLSNEYILKCKQSTRFDRDLGGNKLVDAYANYLVRYAQFLDYVNKNIENKQTYHDSDIKYYHIDLYCEIVEQAFSSIDTVNAKSEQNELIELRQVRQTENIVCINKYLSLDVSYSSNVNYFITYYKACDNYKLAKNFKSYIYDEVEGSENSKEESVVRYYLAIFA